jgi:hypothetical protein
MSLKSKLANRILNSKLKALSRNKKVFNLDSAQTAGILWETDQEAAFRHLEKELQNSGIKVTGLCYQPIRKMAIPDGINGFTRKQASWWLEIPKTKVAEDFIQQRLDVLIDLTGQKSFPIAFTTALSNAAFKIGSSGNSTNYFDWNIEFSEQPDTGQLTQQILYYLKRINKTTLE